MGMFENLSKQLENLEDDDDAEIDDATVQEAEKMMKGLFGGMMGSGSDSETDAMMQNLFKSMGISQPGAPGPK